MSVTVLVTVLLALPGGPVGGPNPAGYHWAFRQLASPSLPTVRDATWSRRPLDVFVLARLEGQGLRPSPEADRHTLVRRLFLDLLGLPPSPAAVAEFVTDPSPDAYPRLVDRLLTSPHFGERWTRHWLDLARYADSNGYEDDRYRPDAWRYRDWVIDAFNTDKPFARFTVEQVAGDLLPDADYDTRVATGFHRMTLTNLAGNNNVEEFRVKQAKDRANTVATAWLGLTVGCAECHTHKYDPITIEEYYSFYAFFDSCTDIEIDAPPLDTRHWQAYERAKAVYERIENKPNDNSAPLPPSSKALVVGSAESPPTTYVQLRGNFRQHGAAVAPRTPAFLPPLRSRRPQSDRLDLARWLAAPENPLTYRVAVNRFWMHLLGRGLVSTPENFGTNGSPPSHPQLLDWLASQFRAGGGSRKAVLREILLSATYRQSAVSGGDRVERDPENLYLSRQARFQVEAEIVRDLCLAASGLLRRRVGGPSFQPPLPRGLADMSTLKSERFMEVSEPWHRYRRGLYVNVQRTLVNPALKAFDAADPNLPCAQRESSTTPLQALALLNEPVFFECAQILGRRLAHSSGDIQARLAFAVRVCLGREPRPVERTVLERLHASHTARYSVALADAARLVGEAKPAVGNTVPRAGQVATTAAWVGVARTLLNLEEFITRE